MGRRIVIEPVTRIEGHARVTIELGDDGHVADTRVHVTQLRGLEALCAGRLLREMPALTSRVCGICPVAHAIASAKACDAVLGVTPPPAARLLRRVVHLAQLVQSHALSFFFLSGPDLVVAGSGEPARGSFFRLAEEAPELAGDGIALRRFGRETIERIAGRGVHAAFAVPGGVARPLDEGARDDILGDVPAALARARRTLDAWWRRVPAAAGEARACGDLDTLLVALVGPGGELEHYDGALRAVSSRGDVVADGIDPSRYEDVVGERVEPWTYAKLAYWRPLGHPAGAYLVGPLARLDVVSRCGTPHADDGLARFRSLAAGPVLTPFHAHLARLVEIVFALERIEELLADREALGREVVAAPSPSRGEGEGVGACEAPRGTLFHRYRVDQDGIVTFADLVVPTGQNSLAMNRAVRQVAERCVSGDRIGEDLLHGVEATLRAFDPCLSCAAHADGVRTVALRLVGPNGEVLDESPPRPASPA